MPLQCATQWDALAHILYEDRMYNGYAASEITSSGAKKNGIENAKSKIITRGVLLDIARYRKKNWLDPGEAIHISCTNGCRYGQRQRRQGDIVLIRTGQIAQCEQRKAGGPIVAVQRQVWEWRAPRGCVRNRSRVMRLTLGERSYPERNGGCLSAIACHLDCPCRYAGG
jgi:hypothetical protein